MSQRPRIGVITNPNSRKNRHDPGRFEDMSHVLYGIGVLRRTTDTADIAEVVREFLDLGLDYWVADGGDGAFHWLTNALVQVRRERGDVDPMPALMPTNAGTIDFLGKRAGVIGSSVPLIRALVRTVRQGREPEVLTLGSARFVGQPHTDSEVKTVFDRIGFAAALAGLSQRIFDKFYAQDDQGAVGVVRVVVATLLSAATQSPLLRRVPFPLEMRHYCDSVFEPMPMDVWVDGQQLPGRTFRDCDVGAIDINLAGIFRFFPSATEPGRLHVQVGDPGPLDVARNLPYMARGKPLQIPDYFQGPAMSLRVVAREGRSIDPVIDGELFWGLSEVEVTPGPPIRVIRLKA